MQYDYAIEIAPNTLEKDPVRVNTPLNAGRLVMVMVYFPWGCAGLANVRILHHEHQLYPTNPPAWLNGNDILIQFECAYDITEGWQYFHVEGYNDAEDYPHTPVVSFVVLPISGLFLPPTAWIEG